MGVIFILIAVVAVGYVGVLLVRGFAPVPPDSAFAETMSARSRFADPPHQVLDAYRRALPGVPGMKIVGGGAADLLVDSRPTVRVLSGDFGSVLRVAVSVADGCTVVDVGYRAKSGFTLSNQAAAFREKERTIRMAAKKVGPLSEKL